MTSVDEVRHRCEVRQWLRWRADRSRDWLQEALAEIERRRGGTAAQMLRDDIQVQWDKGNRGEWGDWR